MTEQIFPMETVRMPIKAGGLVGGIRKEQTNASITFLTSMNENALKARDNTPYQ
jgi:hypothetical protein